MKATDPRNIRSVCPGWLITLLMCTPAFAQTSTPAQPAASTSAEAVVLSPFTVEADSEQGYLATQTLSGTRLKTDLRDIGASLTIFTEQLMDDLGANSIYDLMAFAPNTDPFIMSTSDVTGNGNDFINVPTKYVSRGGATAVVGQDFFANNIPNDRFNSEALTFTRGPNAILFGLGNAAGAFISSTKRAKNKTATSIEYQVDDRGSFRGTLDHNQVIKKGFAAIRYSGLYEELNSFRIPTESFQRRHFATLNLTPFKKTTLRVNYEKGLINAPAVRPWPDYDAVSPWLAAGSPMIETFVNTGPGKPAGIQNYGNVNLVSTVASVGGTRLPTQKFTNQGQSTPTTFANGFPVNGSSFRSLVNEDIFPTFASNFGNTSFRLTDFRILSVFLEQQITRDLFIEAAYNKVDNNLKAINGFVGQLAYIYVDPNKQLPNGQPNPNAGLLYSESQGTVIDAPNGAENIRVMASYNLDFTRRPGWAKHLGRHQAALFAEHTVQEGWSSNNSMFNSTPLATTGAAANINNGNNSIRFRYYFEPEKGKIGTGAGDYIRSRPVLYANDPLPARDPSGITPAFFSFQGPTMTESVVETRAIATQSFFWKDRIVVINGLRQDDQRSWLAVPNDFASLRDANGVAPRPSGINLREFKAGTETDRGGKTFSRGIVFHAFPWLSLSYNTSNNFQVNAGTRNIYGDLLPNPEGEGSDYGLKFSFFNRRLFLELTHYTNSNLNGGDSISNNAAGNFKQFDQLWIAVSEYTGDVKYLTSPYSTLSTVWQDVVSTTSKGYEFSLTANPTPRWRLTLNGSKRGDNTTSARGGFINQYMAEYIPVIKSNPDWLPVVTNGNITVGDRVAALEETLVNFNAIRNSPSANFASNWTLNLVQSFDFGRTGPLRGFSIGGSMNARGKAINGFAVDAKNVLDPTRPYYAPAYVNFGAWITYRRKIYRDRIDWRLQMNVRNVFDRNTIYPLINVDTRDGRNTPDVAVYTLKEPRTFQFTSTFRF